jgi:hypothetical protein
MIISWGKTAPVGGHKKYSTSEATQYLPCLLKSKDNSAGIEGAMGTQ